MRTIRSIWFDLFRDGLILILVIFDHIFNGNSNLQWLFGGLFLTLFIDDICKLCSLKKRNKDGTGL